MPAYRRVLGERAGPTAVGILVPPGPRTLVVVRPRMLDFDLVLTQPGEEGRPGAGFQEMGRLQAGRTAHQLSQALVHWAEHGQRSAESAVAADGTGYWVWVDLDGQVLLACRRTPGQAYRPAAFTAEEAAEAAAQVTAALRPGPDANRELYTNTSHFNR